MAAVTTVIVILALVFAVAVLANFQSGGFTPQTSVQGGVFGGYRPQCDTTCIGRCVGQCFLSPQADIELQCLANCKAQCCPISPRAGISRGSLLCRDDTDCKYLTCPQVQGCNTPMCDKLKGICVCGPQCPIVGGQTTTTRTTSPCITCPTTTTTTTTSTTLGGPGCYCRTPCGSLVRPDISDCRNFDRQPSTHPYSCPALCK